MKKEDKKIRIKRMPRWFYKEMFDGLMDIAIRDRKISKKLAEHFDVVADYLGDVAMKRK